MFSGLNSLKILNLGYNKLSRINSEPFVGLPRPLEIKIFGNRLACNDGLRQIQNETDAGTILIQDARKNVSLVDKFCHDGVTDDTHIGDTYIYDH